MFNSIVIILTTKYICRYMNYLDKAHIYYNCILCIYKQKYYIYNAYISDMFSFAYV